MSDGQHEAACRERWEATRVRQYRPVSYTHLRAHETPEHLVCRLLLEKKKNNVLIRRRCAESIIHNNKRTLVR